MTKYRSKGDLGARTEVERDNTEHVLDHQSRVRVRIDSMVKENRVGVWMDGSKFVFFADDPRHLFDG